MAPKKSWGGRQTLAAPTDDSAVNTSTASAGGRKSWGRPSTVAPAVDTPAQSNLGAAAEQRKSWKRPSSTSPAADEPLGSSTPAADEQKKSWKRPGSLAPVSAASEGGSGAPSEKKKSWSRPSTNAPSQDMAVDSSSTMPDEKKNAWKRPSGPAPQLDTSAASSSSIPSEKKSWSRQTVGAPPAEQPAGSSTSAADEQTKSWKRPGSLAPPTGTLAESGATAANEKRKSWSRPSTVSHAGKAPMDVSPDAADAQQTSSTAPQAQSLASESKAPGNADTRGKLAGRRVTLDVPEATEEAAETEEVSTPESVTQPVSLQVSTQERVPQPSRPSGMQIIVQDTSGDNKQLAKASLKGQNDGHLHPAPSETRHASYGRLLGPISEPTGTARKASILSCASEAISECWSDDSAGDPPPDTSQAERSSPVSALSHISSGMSSPEVTWRSSELKDESSPEIARCKSDLKVELERLRGELAEQQQLTLQRQLDSTVELKAELATECEQVAKLRCENAAESRVAALVSESALLLSASEGKSNCTSSARSKHIAEDPALRMSRLKEELASESSSFAARSWELREGRDSRNELQVQTLKDIKEELLASSTKLFNMSTDSGLPASPQFTRMDYSNPLRAHQCSHDKAPSAEMLKDNLRRAGEQVAMLQATCKFKGVGPSDELYEKIADLLRSQGLPRAHIKQIIKTEMPSPYVQAYEANRGGKEEKELWLCTGGLSPRMILESPCGLDYRYSAVGKLGRGLYGAVDAIYADCLYAFKTRRQEQQMLLFKGITGRSYNYKDAAVSYTEDVEGDSGTLEKSLSHTVSLAGYDSAFTDDLCSACAEADIGMIMAEKCTCLFTHRYQPEAYNKSAECKRQLPRRRISSPVYCLFPPCGDRGAEGMAEDVQRTTADQLIDAQRLRPHVLALPIALVEYINPDTLNEPDWNTWYDKDATLNMTLLREMKEEQEFQIRLQNDILQQKDQLQYELEEAEVARDRAAQDLAEHEEGSVHSAAFKNAEKKWEVALQLFEMENRVEQERSESKYSNSLGKLEQQVRDANSVATFKVSAFEHKAQEAEFLEGIQEANLARALKGSEAKCEMQSSEFNAELEAQSLKVENLVAEVNLLEMVTSTTKLEHESRKQDHLAEQRHWQEHETAEASVCRSMAVLHKWARLLMLMERLDVENAWTTSMRAASTTLSAQRTLANHREEMHKMHALAAHRLMFTDWQMRLANTRSGLRARSMAFEQWRHQISDESSAHMAASNALLLTQALEDLKIKSEEEEGSMPWSGLLPECAAALFSEELFSEEKREANN